MANTGNVFPTIGEATASGFGTWTNPENIVSDDGVDATITTTGASGSLLIARGFGFSIPTGSTITGVLVRIEASESAGGSEPLLAILRHSSGNLGIAKAVANEGNISGASKSIYTYGSTSNVWDATLTAEIVNDATFAVRFNFSTVHSMAVDFVTVAIEYTPPAGTTGTASVTSTATPTVTKAKGAQISVTASSTATPTVAGLTARTTMITVPSTVTPTVGTTKEALVVVSCTLTATCTVSGLKLLRAWIATDNFESYTPGELNTAAGGTNWLGAWGVTTLGVFSRAVAPGGGMALSAVSIGATTNAARNCGFVTLGTVQWRMQLNRTDHDDNAMVALTDGSNYRAAIGFRPDGTISIFNGGGVDVWVPIISIAADTWYTCRLEFNDDTELYRGSVDGGAWSSWVNQNAGDPVDWFVMFIAGGSGGTTTFWVDDIGPVSEIAAVIPLFRARFCAMSP